MTRKGPGSAPAGPSAAAPSERGVSLVSVCEVTDGVHFFVHEARDAAKLADVGAKLRSAKRYAKHEAAAREDRRRLARAAAPEPERAESNQQDCR